MSTGMGFQVVGSRTGKLGSPWEAGTNTVKFLPQEPPKQSWDKTESNYPKSKQKARSMLSWTSIQLQN